MTRYTKLERKRHVEASESFSVTPLVPAKKVPSSDSVPPVPPAPPETHKKLKAEEANDDDKKKSKKRKAADSSESTNTSVPSGEANNEVVSGPSKVKRDKEKTLTNKKNKTSAPTDQDKSAKSEKRRLRRQKEKTNASVCFACRKSGHSAKNCKEASGIGMCYNCGSSEHTSKDCKKLSKSGNKFQFAMCFVCKEQGHLSGQCSKNDKGLYPKGGSCRFCGKVDHLAKDCQLTKEEAGTIALGKIDLSQGADDDDYHIFVDEKRKLTEEQKSIKKMAKVTPKVEKKIVSF